MNTRQRYTAPSPSAAFTYLTIVAVFGAIGSAVAALAVLGLVTALAWLGGKF